MKIPGKMEMENQMARKENLSHIDPHDRRFEVIDDTYYHTRLSRPPLV